MDFKLELTYGEIIGTLNTKHSDAKSTGYSLPPDVYKASNFNSMLISLFQDDVRVNNTNDDFIPRSSLTNINTIRFIEKSFFYTSRISSITFRSFERY